MKKPPPHMAIELTENETISQVAAIEAAMTFLKIQAAEPGAKFVYIYPEIIQTREEMFLFAMEYGKFLDAYRAGRKEIPQPVREMHASSRGTNN